MSDNAYSIRPPVSHPEVSPIRIFNGAGDLRPLEDIERDVICLAIVMSNGCMTKAAAQLGIGRSTLYRKLPELEASLAYVPWAT